MKVPFTFGAASATGYGPVDMRPSAATMPETCVPWPLVRSELVEPTSRYASAPKQRPVSLSTNPGVEQTIL